MAISAKDIIGQRESLLVLGRRDAMVVGTVGALDALASSKVQADVLVLLARHQIGLGLARVGRWSTSWVASSSDRERSRDRVRGAPWSADDRYGWLSLSHDRYQRARSHVYIRWLHALVGTIAEVLAIPDVVLAAFGIDERCIDLIGLLARRSLALTGREFVSHRVCVCIKRLVFV